MEIFLGKGNNPNSSKQKSAPDQVSVFGDRIPTKKC
jgi:hypothetical protein